MKEISETDFDRLRDGACEIEQAFGRGAGDELGERNLWKLGIMVGRVVGLIMRRHGHDGADALTGISIFCDVVFAEAAHTITIERKGDRVLQ